MNSEQREALADFTQSIIQQSIIQQAIIQKAREELKKKEFIMQVPTDAILPDDRGKFFNVVKWEDIEKVLGK